MGTVYLAEQTEPVRRRVALKVLNRSKRTERGIARFEAERQALALMNHPSIATVYEAGTTDSGLPFFAMEPVVGRPLLEFCAQERLGLAARLELFCQVCDAVQHAHQKLVIHRDLKPSNILVTIDSGRHLCKVIDFGIATGLERPLVPSPTLEGRPGVPVGTPVYMSPEQITGDVDLDARVDVYALGVLLYRLLAGALPVDADDAEPYQQMMRMLDPELPRPSARFASLPPDQRERIASRRDTTPGALERGLRGDLDAIVMKAMARDRGQRYGSAAELKADVDRHLRRVPVHARPSTAWYRVRRWGRRNLPTAVAVTGTVVVMLAGLILTTTAMIRAQRARDEARAAEHRATVAVGYLRKVLASADPGVDGRQVRVVDVLTKASNLVRSDLADQPLVEAEVSQTIGLTLLELGAYEESRGPLERAAALNTEILGADHLTTLDSVNSMGRLLYKVGRYQEAAEVHRRVLDRQRELLGPQEGATLWTAYNLAKALDRLGAWGEAEALYRDLLATRGRLLGPDHPDTLVAANSLSLFLSASGRSAEAEALERDAIADLERVAGPDHPDTLRGHVNLVTILNHQQRFAEAQELALTTLPRLRPVLGAEHTETLGLSSALAEALRGQGRVAEAEVVDRQVLAARFARLGAAHPDTIRSESDLGLDLLTLGRVDEASRLLASSLDGARQVLPPAHPAVALAASRYGACLARFGRLEEAERLLAPSRESLATLGDPAAREATVELAELYRRTGRTADADELSAWLDRRGGSR
jgi:non-specific serine/threonine protein kinase/serine/threonine-protein kinase